MSEPNKERLHLFFNDDELLFADGFDAAIIGLDTNSMRVVYSKQKMIDCLVDDGMDLDEAIEYLEFKAIWKVVPSGFVNPLYTPKSLTVEDTEALGKLNPFVAPPGTFIINSGVPPVMLPDKPCGP